MKVKTYEVTVRNETNGPTYLVDAPNKHIARWCGANLFNNEYVASLTAKHMVAKILREE